MLRKSIVRRTREHEKHLVRVGVIGTGGWGKNHLRVLDEMHSLAAFCDTDKAKVNFYSEKYRVKGYHDFQTMLESEALHALTICTPASTHYSIASSTLEQGYHTFVEKPMATSVKEAGSLVEIAKKAGRILTVGFIERFNPAIAELKKVIAEERLGAPILLEFHRENRRGENITDVGVVKDASVHDIDTARWLFDEEPKSVFARVGNVTSKMEDFAAIMLGFGEQRTAFILTNWVTPNRVRTLEAVFTKGVVSIDFITQETRIHEEDVTTVPKRPLQEPLLIELREYVSAVEKNRQPVVTGKDGVEVLRIAEAVLASSQTGSPIFLSG